MWSGREKFSAVPDKAGGILISSGQQAMAPEQASAGGIAAIPFSLILKGFLSGHIRGKS